MGSCIICGTSTDGAVCSLHEEDVAFVFEGDSPEQLTPGRYYRGTVDGYADFGVFVDIGDSVTGLLHRNELDRRLESLDWEPGDTVFVRVENVRDNGNVDLGWSTRQSLSAFRGTLIDAPDGEHRRTEEPESSATNVQVSVPEESDSAGPAESAADTTDASAGEAENTSGETPTGGAADAADASAEADRERVTMEALEDRVGDLVRIEGEVTDIRQTSGPTVFEVRDESGSVECAAFEAAGVRAYPEVERGDYVRLDGEVERRRGDLQVETETLLVLAGEERAAVVDRIETALERRARPSEVAYLSDADPLAPLADAILDAATAVRRAVSEGRPIVVRHTATVDGYAAGAALERAILPRIRSEHARSDAEYHYLDRRPLDDPVYGMDAVIGDLTNALEICERHDEPRPLFVLIDLGSSGEALDAFKLLESYDIDRVVIDDGVPADGLENAAAAVVDPHLSPDLDAETTTSTALTATVGATVEPSVVDDLRPLPGISYWETPPRAYETLAEAAGYDDSDRQRIREALAIEAYYQSHNGKRELISDLLFGDATDLVEHVADQYRERLQAELDPAREHLSRKEAAGVTFAVLDTDKFSHRFDFPPTGLLLEELHRRERAETDGPLVTLGVGVDEIYVRSTEPVDLDAIVDRAAEVVDGVSVVGGEDGYIEFLSGIRDEALEAVVGAVAARVGGTAQQ